MKLCRGWQTTGYNERTETSLISRLVSALRTAQVEVRQPAVAVEAVVVVAGKGDVDGGIVASQCTRYHASPKRMVARLGGSAAGPQSMQSVGTLP